MRLIELGSVPSDSTTAAELRSVPTDQIKRELLRRNCVEFSKISLHMRLSVLYLVLALLVATQLGNLSRWWECFS